MTGRPHGKVARVGLWLALPEPLVVEAAGRAGADWVGLDLQHGAWDMSSAFRAIQLLDAVGMPALVRLSELELHVIPRVLDHGASGVVVAMASAPEIVTEAVRRARYQPEGERSYGGQRYGLRPEPTDISELRPYVYAMIEDRRGLDRVNEIAAVPGLAGLHIGPVDLKLGLGLGLEREGEAFDAALRSILIAGREAGLPVTMHAVLPDEAGRWMSIGFDELVMTADIQLLRTAFEDGVGRIRDASTPGSGGAEETRAPAPYGRA